MPPVSAANVECRVILSVPLYMKVSLEAITLCDEEGNILVAWEWFSQKVPPWVVEIITQLNPGDIVPVVPIAVSTPGGQHTPRADAVCKEAPQQCGEEAPQSHNDKEQVQPDSYEGTLPPYNPFPVMPPKEDRTVVFEEIKGTIFRTTYYPPEDSAVLDTMLRESSRPIYPHPPKKQPIPRY